MKNLGGGVWGQSGELKADTPWRGINSQFLYHDAGKQSEEQQSNNLLGASDLVDICFGYKGTKYCKYLCVLS